MTTEQEIGLSDEQQAVLGNDFQQRALHQTLGQAYIRCFATNKLPAEVMDAKLALANIVDDLHKYSNEIDYRFRIGEILPSEMVDVFAEIEIAKQKLADASMWMTRVYTTYQKKIVA